jgi:signal transduction histidine kinase
VPYFQKLQMAVGGKWAISWQSAAYVLPFLLVIVPISEGAVFTWWAFWRWTFVSFISLIPVVIIFFFADITIFKNREKNPVPNYYVFILGFILGFVRGGTAGFVAYYFNALEMDMFNAPGTILFRALNAGLIGMVAIPLISLVGSSIEIYRADRNALIAERLLAESQKSESAAVIKSLRSSMTRRVDENLLEVVKNSQEYLDDKGRSLEANWELMAVRLRKAALDTIRPFSHHMHRRGEEKTYKVNPIELLRYMASTVRIEIPWVLAFYAITNSKILYSNSEWPFATANLTARLILIALGLGIIRKLKYQGQLRGLASYFLSLFIFGTLFTKSTHILDKLFKLKHDSEYSHYVDTAWLLFIVVFIGFVSSFFYTLSAESEFLEKQISKEKLEMLILKREEERLSRELAKYLHGTIQSRLMASAMALERAGRKGDKKALERELEEAYKSLRVPSAEYFSAPEATLKEEITKVVAKWNELMKVKVKIGANIPSIASHKSQEIGNVINEGLSNSFRHGNASTVEVSITQKLSRLYVVVKDDGTGIDGGKPGLGTEWFKAIAGNSWSLTTNEDGPGTTLELRINA